MTLVALDPRFLVESKQITWVLAGFGLNLTFVHPVEQMAHVFACILLSCELKFRMVFAEKVLEDLGSDAILVKFIWLVLRFFIICVNFLCQFFIAVFA